MMRVAMHNADGGKYPNLALLKLAAWHKARGDSVERWIVLSDYDRVYSSKVFSWTKTDTSLPESAIKGGTGYDSKTNLPDEVEHFCPDYAFAGLDYSLGFLTRGCIRSCPWCGACQGRYDPAACRHYGIYPAQTRQTDGQQHFGLAGIRGGTV